MMASADSSYQRITSGSLAVSNEMIREILDAQFGISDANIAALAGETDQNLRVTTGTGAEYVLKICDASDRMAVEFQTGLLRHLAENFPGLPVPRVIPSVLGDPVVSIMDRTRLVRLLSWVPGIPLAEVARPSVELLADVGEVAGRLATATAAFTHPVPPASHYWDFRHAAQALAESVPAVSDAVLRAALRRLESGLVPLLDRLPELPSVVIHHDLNVFNVLVSRHGIQHRVSGMIDFGDALLTARVADLAVLVSSAMRGSPDPLRVASIVAAAYHRECRLTEPEIDLLYPLVAVRAAVVVATTARMAANQDPGDVRHRSQAAAGLVHTLSSIPAAVGVAAMRVACGLPAHPRTVAVTEWLASNRAGMSPVADGALSTADLSTASPVFDGVDPRDSAALHAAASQAIVDRRPVVSVGRYAEPRFGGLSRIQTGIELFGAPGTPVFAPLEGRVVPPVSGVDLILRHELTDGVPLWTLYSGLDPDVTGEVSAGGRIGKIAESGVRIQVSVAPVDDWDSVPDAVSDSESAMWQGILLDPTPLLGIHSGVRAWEPAIGKALRGRQEHLPHTHPTYFQQPINMVRARDCWFYDERGTAYLDALNNVTLLGHCHPRLVEVASRQLGRLNTNSRFVYDVLSEYAEKLTATLPDGLDVVYFVNSGSEANDLALRMSRYVTGREDIVIIDDAYHGYTSVVSDVSPARYKHYGKPDTTHPTSVPDRYRGEYGYDNPRAGERYAQRVIETFDKLSADGRPAAAYLFEALLASGGQVVLPPGYLAPIFAAAAERGVLTIADEVQVGFGRLGEAFWGFQTQGPGVVPDFVTMGKSIGNGYPMAAMVTTRDISTAFDPTGRFFSTYGGNPVACAVGLELLAVMEDEGLQQNALVVGQYFRDRLQGLAVTHDIIGDVRGQGFYSGVEFVRDRTTKEPAIEETLTICERLKDEGILVYPTGPLWNILKLKPPLTFTQDHVDQFVEKLDQILATGW